MAPEILVERAGGQIEIGDEALLPDRARGHADDGEERGREIDRRDAAADRAELGGEHDRHAGKADGEPEPVAGHDPFSQENAGHDGGDQRLEADDQGRQPRRQAVADGPEHPAEIDAVHQHAGDHGMPGLGPGAQPGDPEQRQHGGQKQEGDRRAHRQEAERLRPGHGVTRADESGRPQDDEQGGREA